MFCKKCGNQLADGANFCTSCGAVLEAQGNQSSNANAQYTPPVQPPLYQQQNVAVKPLSVGDYIVMFLLLAIPFVNIVLLFV